MSPESARVAVVGATGYTGSELVRLLVAHPHADLVAITSESRAGEAFSSVHPAFQGVEDRPLVGMDALSSLELDVVFLALPHRVSMEFVRDHGLERFRIVDLSGDFRLRSRAVYEQWYETEHAAPQHLPEAVFGLPELHRGALRDARLVANPGCYPTSAILALLPLLETGLVEPTGLVVDAKSGVTGAGAKAKATTHFPDVFGNFAAYGLLSHRHTPEIEQALGDAAGGDVSVLFTPHLLPIDRGILATTYAQPARELDASSLRDLYGRRYESEPFVRVVSAPPAVKNVRGSNHCDVYVTHDPRTGRVLALAAIDNLVKGAAGQAVQNMNAMLGWPETAGLKQGPLNP
jgi:N-acetyl-gamma-glutamyl-phosphate reductase